MKEGVAKKWVKALRSGKHKQGFGEIEDSRGRLCCLGVLQGPVLGLETFGLGLDKKAMELAGINESEGAPADGGRCLIDGKAYPCLSAANDDNRRFKSIANWIEKNWQRL